MESEASPTKKGKRIDPDMYFIIWLVAIGVAMGGILGSVLLLTAPPFIPSDKLYATYFAYSVQVVIFLHILFIGLNGYLRRKHNKTLHKNTPRYLEYAYAALLSLSLFQIFFMSPEYLKFMILTNGDESEIVNRIQQHAKNHLSQDCPKGEPYFPQVYCEKLKRLVESKNPNDYIVNRVITDDELLSHVIGKRGNRAGGLDSVMSPIRRDALSLKTIREYRAFPTSNTMRPVLTWIAFILVPVGIGLRVVKTSLELFGKLK